MKKYCYLILLLPLISVSEPSSPRIRVIPLTEPQCLEVRADAMPSDLNPILSNDQIDENFPSLLGRLKKILRQGRTAKVHYLGFKTASLVYLLPDLETARSAESFVEQFQNFQKEIPSGYAIYYLFSDPRFGLKYALLSPRVEGPESPWILAISGTQTMKDWVADADLGRRQVERLTKLFTQCVFQNSKKEVVFDRKLLITGHSLGGGLAQAIGYEIHRRLLRVLPAGAESPVSVVTWNAFGGQNLVERIAPFQNEVAVTMEATHYFVRGDLVSKIGHHMGRTLELLPRNPTTGEVREVGFVKAHSLATLSDIIGGDSFRLVDAKEVRPPEAHLLTNLSKLGRLFVDVPQGFYLLQRYQLIDVIKKSADLTAEKGLGEPGMLQLMRYLRQLAFDEKERLLKEGRSLYAEDIDRSLRKSERRFLNR